MNVSEYSIILLLSLLSGLTTLIGWGLAYLCKKSCGLIVMGAGFSAGIMILISFFELLPEAANQLPLAMVLLIAVGGALFSMIANRTIPHFHFMQEQEPWRKPLLISAYTIVMGLILHDLPEGFAIANSYLQNNSLGIMVAVAVALHNIPEKFATVVPLLAAGEKKKTIINISVLSTLAEPAGAVLGIVAVHIFSRLSPWLLGFTAGIMIYISLHELLPMAHRYHQPAMLRLGLFISAAVFVVLRTFF